MSRTWETTSFAMLRSCFLRLSLATRPTATSKSKGSTAYLSRLIDANIEGYSAIRNAGQDDAEFEGAAYRKNWLKFFKLICATSLGKMCVSEHAMNAIDEMSALNRDIKKFYDENGAKYPVWLELEKEAGKYLK